MCLRVTGAALLAASGLVALGCAPSGKEKAQSVHDGGAAGSARALAEAGDPSRRTSNVLDASDASNASNASDASDASDADDVSPYPMGGEVIPSRARPTYAETPLMACSFDAAVCVHGAFSAPFWALTTILRHAEDVLAIHRAISLPAPLPDGGLGGSPAFDIYLLAGAEPTTTAIDLDNLTGPLDQSSAFSVLPPPSARDGCVPRAAVARSLAHAVIARLDTGAEAGAIAVAASYLASLTAPCSVVEIAAVDAAQREPERSILGAPSVEPSELSGSMLFPLYLDDSYGTGRPAGVILGLLAAAVQRTPPGSARWHNEPDIFDSLRASLRARNSTLEDLLLDFAVARAFVGSRSDGAHLSDAARFGDLGRVRFEWSVPFESLPRRLAPGRPIEPTGSTYLWLDLAGARSSGKQHAELTFVADWELPAVFRWALVKVDRSGAEVGRVNVAGIFGSSHAERSVVGLDDLAGVLVVGVNAGSMDRSHPFDPDEAPFMPHAYTVTLVK